MARMSNTEGRNCIDIVVPFVAALEGTDASAVQLLGGIGSAALKEPATMICAEDRVKRASEGLHVPQYRPDGNLRDMDLLVISSDDEAINTIKHHAKMTIGDQLEISIFGLRPNTKLETQHRRPFGWAGLKAFLGDRYVAPGAQGDSISGKRALFPFAVPLTPESMETWRLYIDDDRSVPIPHPGASILNYLTRSVSGLRPKDHDKVNDMVQRVSGAYPEVIDWIVDGPGADQLELARILHTLREPDDNPQTLVVGDRITLKPYPLAELLDNPAFMLRDVRPRTQERAVTLAHTKGRVLHAVESNPRVVTLWQRFAEQRAGSIVNNS